MRILYTILLAAYIFACSNEPQYKCNDLYILTDNPAEINLARAVETISVLNLSCNDDFYLTNMDKVAVLDNHFYILDLSSDAIVKYSLSGEQICTFRRVGKAQNEYVSIEDFTCDSTNIYILTAFKLFVLNRELEIERVMRCEDIDGLDSGTFLERICNHKNRILLYSNNKQSVYSMCKNSFEITKLLTDDRDLKNNNVIERLASSSSNKVFHTINNTTVLVNMQSSDNIYKIENEKASLWKTLNYKDKKSNYEIATTYKGNDLHRKVKFPYINSIFKSNEKYFINYGSNRIVVFDDETGEAKDYTEMPKSRDIDEFERISVPYDITLNNQLYYMGNFENSEGKNLKEYDYLKWRYSNATIVDFPYDIKFSKSEDICTLMFIFSLGDI